jgi:hypothetical protein
LNFNKTISAASSLPQKFRLLCSSMRAILRRKADHLALSGPFRRQVGEASDAHAMREPASDGGCSELATNNRLVGSSSHHAVPYKQRFPGVVQIAPNWRVKCSVVPAAAFLDCTTNWAAGSGGDDSTYSSAKLSSTERSRGISVCQRDSFTAVFKDRGGERDHSHFVFAWGAAG